MKAFPLNYRLNNVRGKNGKSACRSNVVLSAVSAIIASCASFHPRRACLLFYGDTLLYTYIGKHTTTLTAHVPNRKGTLHTNNNMVDVITCSCDFSISISTVQSVCRKSLSRTVWFNENLLSEHKSPPRERAIYLFLSLLRTEKKE